MSCYKWGNRSTLEVLLSLVFFFVVSSCSRTWTMFVALRVPRGFTSGFGDKGTGGISLWNNQKKMLEISRKFHLTVIVNDLLLLLFGVMNSWLLLPLNSTPSIATSSISWKFSEFSRESCSENSSISLEMSSPMRFLSSMSAAITLLKNFAHFWENNMHSNGSASFPRLYRFGAITIAEGKLAWNFCEISIKYLSFQRSSCFDHCT